MFSWSSAHSRDCAWKQESRKDRVDALSPVYGVPHTDLESKIHGLSLSHLVDGYAEGHFSGYDIIRAYGKRALAAHNATNCLTDLIFDDALTGWDPDTKQPLLGVPISIKDCINVQGCDTTVGYSRNVRHPAARDAAIVRLLRDAGALVYAKTTNPTGLFGCETFSDLFGYTSNPYNAAYAAGGSTGGGAALLAYRGSKIEIGTDIGGSLRAPAHWCGVYGMKASVGRFPGEGCVSCSPGLEGIQIITSPMAHDLADLEEFWKRMMQMQPWKYDQSVIPMPWRDVDFAGKKLKFGVIWDDGVIPPSPACTRALKWVAEALRAEGHNVVDFDPSPTIVEGLKLGYPIAFSDAGAQVIDPLRRGEGIEPAVRATYNVFHLPKFVKNFLSWITRRFVGDSLGADLIDVLHPPTPLEERALILKRDDYRQRWHERWNAEEFDFLLTAPHPMPAIPRHTTAKVTMSSSSSTFVWNVIDYTTAVMPITFVDKALDALPADFSLEGRTGVAKDAYTLYDAEKMHGLPVGIQIVGRRLEEERVLKGMGVIKDAMAAADRAFVGKEF